MSVDVQLWLVRDDALDEATLRPQYDSWLNAAERGACAAFHHAHHRWQATVTRALLRWALSQHEPSVPPQAWVFGTGPWGKPQVSGPLPRAAAPRFNLTHTDGLIALAVCAPGSGVEVGVDAERLPARVHEPVDRGDEVLGWAELALSPAEWAGLQATPPARRHVLALRIWTLKEAWAKARGEGLNLPLTELTLWPAALPPAAVPADRVAALPMPHTALQLGLGPAWADDARHDWIVWAPQLPDWPQHLLALAWRHERSGQAQSPQWPAPSDPAAVRPRLQVWQGTPGLGFDRAASGESATLCPLQLMARP
jgi:phosphopantetheinyl transferase